ncbi:MAG: GNAT family N-acetyltransferase [bacterium]
MIDIIISPYTAADNESALRLEKQCIQGKSLVLKYKRPTFHARSEVYDEYKILCAKVEDELVGIVAWSEKPVMLHGNKIRAAYMYDLRVHPEYRKKGVSYHLTRALFEDIGQKMDCSYTLVAGENDRCLKPAQRLFGMKLTLPLTYVVMPVYKKLKEKNAYCNTSAKNVHDLYLQNNQNIDFVPEFNEKKLLGYVTSIEAKNGNCSGCSVWTNENLLAEQVVMVPSIHQIQRVISAPLRPFLNLPYIPKPTDTIRSWFLFDFFAEDEKGVQGLLANMNNIAFEHGRTFLYILLQSNSRLLSAIQRTGHKIFTFPYYFLAKGSMIPTNTEEIYIDIRDL